MNHSRFIYVYQTICEPNGKSYIGVRKTNRLNDGYIGCGIKNQNDASRNYLFHNAVRKYGYENFRHYILGFYDTYEEALDEEKYIVNLQWVKSRNNYNAALGGRGATFEWMSEEERNSRREKLSIAHRKWLANGGYEKRKEIARRTKWVKKFGKDNHRFGKPANNRKSVIQFDLEGKQIGKFMSAKEAALAINDSPANVSASCRGKYAQCRGFIFRYEHYTDAELILLNERINKKQRIYKADGSFTMTATATIRNSPLKGRCGRKATEESKLKMSLSHLGKKKPHSEETKIKIGLANKGKVYGAEIRKIKSDAAAKYKKPIVQFDMDGNKIREYDSISAVRESGFDKNTIKSVLHGRLKTHKGFIFKFKPVLE